MGSLFPVIFLLIGETDRRALIPMKHKHVWWAENRTIEIKDQFGNSGSKQLDSSHLELSNRSNHEFLRRFWDFWNYLDIREDGETGERAGNTKFGRDYFERVGNSCQASDFSFSTPFVRYCPFWQQKWLSWNFYTDPWKNERLRIVERYFPHRMTLYTYLYLSPESPHLRV